MAIDKISICFRLIPAVLLFLSIVQASGQTIDTTRVYEIREVTVSAERIRREVIPVQRLDGKVLERLNSHSVADALRYFSGVQLKDYGGIGGLKTVNIRSMGSQHVGVFYDGIEIGNAQNGVVDLGRFSLDNMEAISLFNGQKSSLFQSAKDFASASSIYLTTRVPRFAEDKKNNTKITFKTGSFDLINPSLLWEHQISKDIKSSLNMEYTKSSGEYKFRYKVNNTIDDRGGYDTTEVRKNGDIEIFRIEQALFGKLKDGEWKTRLYYYSSERGYPGAVVKNPGEFKYEDRQTDRNFFFQSSLKKQISTSFHTQLTGKYAYDYIYYVSDTSSLGNKYKIHDVYLSSANMISILPFWSANISIDYQWNKMDSDMDQFIYPQRHIGWIVAATSFTWPKLTVQASLLGTFVHESTRQETAVQQDWKRYTPTISASWRPWSAERLYLRAFYKDVFRMPTFSEIYLTYTGGSPSFLKPEYAKQFNIGVMYSKNIGKNIDINGQVDAYYNHVKDKILARPGGANFRWTMMNVGLVKIRGIDASLGAASRVGKDIKLTGRVNYTYQKAQDYTPMKALSDTISYKGQISYIPWHSGSGLFSVSYRSWDLSYSFIYTGKRYSESANIPDNKVLEWYTHDLAVSKLFRWDQLQLKATVEVNNLMNQAYDVVKNYPMPGTNFKFIFNFIF